MRSIKAGLVLFVALGFGACDSATAPTSTSEGTSPTATGVTQVELDAARAANLELGIQSAELSEGFCFTVIMDPVTGPNGFTGVSSTVTTPSGVKNYHCKTDLLFGDGLTEVFNVRGAVVFDFSGIRFDCHIRATPGANGQGHANCQEKT